MGSRKFRQGKSLDIKEVRIFPRPLAQNQVAREKAKADVAVRVGIANRVIDWLYGRVPR